MKQPTRKVAVAMKSKSHWRSEGKKRARDYRGEEAEDHEVVLLEGVVEAR